MARTKEDRINRVWGGRGHVVLLGSGASRASTDLRPERSGKKLPIMADFIDMVGLRDIVDSLSPDIRDDNFEKLYSKLHRANPASAEILEIERRVYDYFKDMKLPDEPTIYDYLVLSLRPRDLIATFNWDPFLYQAYCRNVEFTKDLPRFSFLHGNVAIGFSEVDKRTGPADGIHKKTGSWYEPTRLLYPVDKKDYNANELLRIEWERVKYWLSKEESRQLTIFGYSAPETDVEAVELMSQARGTPEERNMEQVEIIDIDSEKEVVKRWKRFIHTHHYDYRNCRLPQSSPIHK